MVRVEQTEFWSDVDVQSPTAQTTAFSRGNDSVYVDETSSLTGWFLDDEALDDEALDEEALDDEALDEEALEAALEASEVRTRLEEPVVPAAPSVLDRPHAVVAHAVYAGSSEPRFNMARFLTLTGSLDAVEDHGRYLVLPRGSFRPRVVLDAVRRISKDFLKDLRSPPRSYSISQHHRPSGWLQL